MPRFIGDSFKVTPINLYADNPEHEKLLFILPKLNKYRFDQNNIPSSGWLSFQSVKDQINSDSEISHLELPEDKTIIPCTVVRHKFLSSLKRQLPPSMYDELPLDKRYSYDALDIVFLKKDNKLISLISANNQNTVDVAINQFFKDKPFTEYGFSFDKTPIEFQIHSDFIYWLFYRFFKKNRIVNSHIIIKEAYLIRGNARVPIKIIYDGRDIQKYLTELKYSISLDRPFEEIGLKLEFKNHIFEFSICTDGCTTFSPSYSEYLKLEEKTEDNLSKLTYIYTEIIPSLKKAYKDDKANWEKEKKNFLKEMGQDAIALIPK